MSPFIILCIISLIYLSCKPKLNYYIERDGTYLSRNWTSFVNAIFIVLVVCSHGLNFFHTSIRDYFPERIAHAAVSQFGQLMVTTFFFFSGYGIMQSLSNKEGYCNKLLFPRFVQLSLNFAIAVMIYFIVHCLLQQEINFYDFLHGLHEFRILGNPSWFILMTLLIYLLTFICFKRCSHTSPLTALSLLTGSLTISIYLMQMVKPPCWCNTLLCFPAGMFYSLKGEQIEGLLKKTKVPGIIYALFFIALGRYLYRSELSPIIYVQNVAGILFALGVTWFAGSFRWQNPSRILIWLGGSGLFTVYMFHMLPMRVITQLGCNDANPYLVWFCVVATTALLISVSTPLYKKINLFLFSKS